MIGLILLFSLRCQRLGHLRGTQHIFNEDAVAAGGVADHHVGDGADKLTVLDDRATAHECGQERTTILNFLNVSVCAWSLLFMRFEKS